MPMSPSSQPGDARSVMALVHATPFLNIDWLFNFNPVTFAALTKTMRVKSPAPVTFSEFKKERTRAMIPFARQLKKRLGPNDAADALRDFSEYLLAHGVAADNEKNLHALIDHLYRLLQAKELRQGSSEGLIEALTGPLLARPPTRALSHQARVTIIGRMEAAIMTSFKRVQHAGYSDDAFSVHNSIVYSYLVFARTLELGISAGVVSRHLHLFRLCATSLWSDLSDETRMRFSGLALDMMLWFYRIDVPFKSMDGFSDGTLADLRTLFQASAQGQIDLPFTTHQWVYRWLADKLDSDVFATRRYSVAVAENLRALSEVEQMAIVELARRFASYREPVNTDNITRFVLQFGTTLRIRGALRLLSHVRFMPLWDLSAAMEKILERELAAQPGESLVVAPLGEQTGSTAIIRYLAAHSTVKDRVTFADDISSALEMTKSGQRIHFIDDCLLSGTQTLSILGDWMGARAHKPNHTIYSRPLQASLKKQLLERHMVFSYCVAIDSGVKRFRRDLPATGLRSEQITQISGVIDPASAKAFEPLGPVGWASEEERSAVKTFASEVGYDLLREREAEKEWPAGRRSESALGYSDAQRLLVFPYNVPKSTVTMLWEKGNSARPWQPLFPGYD